jgi:hypothetical protein
MAKLAVPHRIYGKVYRSLVETEYIVVELKGEGPNPIR